MGYGWANEKELRKNRFGRTGCWFVFFFFVFFGVCFHEIYIYFFFCRVGFCGVCTVCLCFELVGCTGFNGQSALEMNVLNELRMFWKRMSFGLS